MKFGDERLPERFWSKCSVAVGDHWTWTAPLNHAGYGTIGIGSKPNRVPRLAHRVAYEALIGPIPHGLQIDHLCRVRCCVNPAHLEPVTPQENTRRGDAGIARGEQIKARSHCPNGHAYQGDNLIIDRRGYRACRICSAMHQDTKNRKRRAA